MINILDFIAIIVPIVLAIFGLGVKGYVNLLNAHNKDSREFEQRLTVLEAKHDLCLDTLGYDLAKVNGAIGDQMEELKKNNKPSVGCLHPNELKKDPQGG